MYVQHTYIYVYAKQLINGKVHLTQNNQEGRRKRDTSGFRGSKTLKKELQNTRCKT